MKRYDPTQPQVRDEWLTLSQSGHLTRIETYHKDTKAQYDNSHVFMHLAVENQLLAPDGSVVRETLQRLMQDGLDRHAALHVIGELYLEFELKRRRPHPDAIDWRGYELELKQLRRQSHGSAA